MKPAPFDYVRAESLDEALQVLTQEGADARVLAGGQSLLPMLNMRLARPSVVVDIMRVADLKRVDERDGTLLVRAGVRQVEVQRRQHLAERHPLLAAGLASIGHAQTRSRGTFCGSVAHADPSAELPLVLVALGGTVHLRSRKKARQVAADTFFAGMMVTERADDELIEAVSFPGRKAETGYAFREIARRFGDYAIVACAAVVNGSTARDLPLPDSSALDDALNEFAWALEARDDLHATASYRRELVRKLGRATLEEAARCRG